MYLYFLKIFKKKFIFIFSRPRNDSNCTATALHVHTYYLDNSTENGSIFLCRFLVVHPLWYFHETIFDPAERSVHDATCPIFLDSILWKIQHKTILPMTLHCHFCEAPYLSMTSKHRKRWSVYWSTKYECIRPFESRDLWASPTSHWI